ncbi:hypothetical protein D9M69_208150 [compost metagenome]
MSQCLTCHAAPEQTGPQMVLLEKLLPALQRADRISRSTEVVHDPAWAIPTLHLGTKTPSIELELRVLLAEHD